MELKFDEKMPVDTTRAKLYLQSIKLDSENEDVYNNQFYNGSKYHKLLTNDIIANEEFNWQEIRTLAEKINEKIELMAELEYLTRKIPIEDSKKQINIIVQQLQYTYTIYTSREKCKNDMGTVTDIYMTNDSPLLTLGYIGKGLMQFGGYIKINTEVAPSAICILFTQLCFEIGLPVITAITKQLTSIPRSPGLPSLVGAVGVIYEHSDIDSAVDSFLNSSAKAPWRFQRILVQESVSQQFRKAMSWKCSLNGSGDSLVYNGREFHLDQLGTTQSDLSEVYVDTYRTTKELLSLLNQYPCYYLSLWANNIAEVNEIAYSVRTPIVWVNNYADFRGPARISESVYPAAFIANKIKLRQNPKLVELSKRRSAWLKLSYETRRDIVCEVLGKDSDELSQQMANSIMFESNNSFVYIQKDFVCSAIPDGSDDLFYYKVTNIEETSLPVKIFQSILLGAAYAIELKDSNIELKKNFDKFINSNVPVVVLEPNEISLDSNGLTLCMTKSQQFDISRKTRIICTNSGTTFAN